MADTKGIELADDTIDEIQKKARANGAASSPAEELFARINGTKPDSGSAQQEASQAAAPQRTQPIRSLRSFQGDLAEAIRNQNISLTDIALAERKRARALEEAEEARRLEAQTYAAPKAPKASLSSIFHKKVGQAPPPAPSSAPAPAPAAIPPVAISTQPVSAPVPTAPRRPTPAPVTAQSSNKKALGLIALSAVFILIGLGSIAGFYILQKERPEIPVVRPEDRSIIPAGRINELGIDAGRDAFVTAYAAARGRLIEGPGEITYLKVQKSPGILATTEEFLSFIGTSAPGSLIRSFNPEFMLGFLAQESQEPFLLIRLESFENAFAGMLDWEVSMNKDIGGFFSPRSLAIENKDDEGGGVSLVNFDAEASFSDETYRNKDARVLKNNRGETVLLYSFLDQKTLLIASNEGVLRAIMDRLISNSTTR
jgi:hypothetical protein